MARNFPDFPTGSVADDLPVNVLFIVYYEGSNYKVTLSDMRQFMLDEVGVLGTRWMGMWNGLLPYKVGDAVYYAPLNSIYVCSTAVGAAPDPGTPNQSPNNDNASWIDTLATCAKKRREVVEDDADTLNLARVEHAGKYLRSTAVPGAEIVIPSYATEAFEPGEQIEIKNASANIMTVTLDGPVTVNAVAGYGTVLAQQTLRLINVAEDEWDASVF